MKKIFYSLLFCAALMSCAEDEDPNNSDNLINTYTIVMDKGPYANKAFKVKDGDVSEEDIAYEPNKNLTIQAGNFIEIDSNRLQASSRINFAFTGEPKPGNYYAVKAIDTLSSQIGSLEFYFQNSDELIMTIFRGDPITITSYEAVGGRIKGKITFTSQIDAFINGKLSYFPASKISVDFDLKRGKDL